MLIVLTSSYLWLRMVRSNNLPKCRK